MLITVFARREPTSVPHAVAMEKNKPGSTSGLTDIAIYRDRECTRFFARMGPDSSHRPRKNTRVIQLNCFPWAVEWVTPLQ